MCGVAVFDKYAQEYDHWFDENMSIYHAEVNALRKFAPQTGVGVEIGVGTGRFAVPLGIKVGVEPAGSMAQIAGSRGISVCQALGEQLPFRDSQFDFVLLVTVLCFVYNVPVFFRETVRVLKTGGRILIGFIDKNSVLGQFYESRKNVSKFCREARFHSVEEVADWAREVGFGKIRFCQTLFGLPDETPEALQVRDGYGEGAFVVLSAEKTKLRDRK